MLGFWQLVALVVGNLVGSGVLMLPASLVPYGGTISIIGWGVASLGAISLSLVFCKLFTKHPRTGGPHVYVEDAFGKIPGFFTAWVYWLLAWIGYAALVVAVLGCITTITGPLSKLSILALEIGIIALFTIINLKQVEFAGKVELVLTVIKVLPLIIIPLIALPTINTEFLASKPIGCDTCTGALAIVVLRMLFAFMGFETGTVPCDEVQNPRVNIPKATVIGTLIAAAIYMIGTVAIFGHIPQDILANSKAPYADLAAAIFGGEWLTFISVAGALCALGALNGWMLVGGRIAFGAASDGIFPKIFLKTDRCGAPSAAIIISSACTIPLLMLSVSDNLVHQFNFVVDISVSLVLIVYLLCMAAFLKFLYVEKESKIYMWVLGAVASGFCAWALSCISVSMTLYSLLAFVSGLPMFWYMNRKTY